MKSSKDRWYNNVVYLFLAGTFCPILLISIDNSLYGNCMYSCKSLSFREAFIFTGMRLSSFAL